MDIGAHAEHNRPPGCRAQQVSSDSPAIKGNIPHYSSGRDATRSSTVVNHGSPLYRGDIDGLRALVLLAVVFFHAEIAGFSGGYVGVDVFFVISGYLITRITAAASLKSRLSVRGFYERRARRILPALIPVGGFSLLGCWLLYPPTEMRDFAQSLAALFLLSSNALFWLEADYFSIAAETKPLLHTWSLAVEEQFYLLYPLVFLLGARYLRRYRQPLLLSGLGLSFVVGAWLAVSAPSAAYYLLPARVWEFLVGVVLATGAIQPIRYPLLKEVLVAAGLTMILYSVVTFDDGTVFPGFNALIPCLGAALVILGGEGQKGIVSRLLSTRGLVFLGVISYSVYLWHWPLLVFFRAWSGRALAASEFLIYMAVIIGVGYLSWKFVETPFRRRQHPFFYRRFLRITVPATAVLVVVGLTGHFERGFPHRFADEQLSLYAAAAYHGRLERQVGCTSTSPDKLDVDNLCVIGDRSQEAARFILWGDSHAEALFPVFDRLAKDYRLKGYYAGIWACPPLYGVDVWFYRQYRDCSEPFAAIASKLEREGVDTLFIAARWGGYIHGFKESRSKLEVDSNLVFDPAFFDDDQLPPRNAPAEVFEYVLASSLSQLNPDKRDVYLIEQVPVQKDAVPRRIFMDELLGREIGVSDVSTSEHRLQQRPVKAAFSRLQREFGFSLIDPASLLCDHNRCRTMMGDDVLYVDHDHLSSAGAMHLADLFRPVFEDLQGPPAVQVGSSDHQASR